MSRKRKTTAELRAKLQESDGSIRSLAARYSLSPTTVQKWRRRHTVQSQKPGPKDGTKSLFPQFAHAYFSLFRAQTGFPLDDCLHVLRIGSPGLSRTTLYRILQRSGSIGELHASSGGLVLGVYRVHVIPVPTSSKMAFIFQAFDEKSRYAVTDVCADVSSTTMKKFIHRVKLMSPFRVIGIHTFYSLFSSVDATLYSEAGVREIADLCHELGLTYRHLPSPFDLPSPFEREIADWPLENTQASAASVDELRDRLDKQTDLYNKQCRIKALRGKSPAAYLRSLK